MLTSLELKIQKKSPGSSHLIFIFHFILFYSFIQQDPKKMPPIPIIPISQITLQISTSFFSLLFCLFSWFIFFSSSSLSLSHPLFLFFLFFCCCWILPTYTAKSNLPCFQHSPCAFCSLDKGIALSNRMIYLADISIYCEPTSKEKKKGDGERWWGFSLY